ncbi:hypothetical protein J6S88_06865 [bacterium]|nr:hypothetical protein [bacterium]
MQNSYLTIFKSALNYVPSKLLVMVYPLIIIPLFSNMLEAKEMSMYFIAIQFLNVICTCSSDWVTKSVLRYHEYYKIKNLLEEFYSNIFVLTIMAHVIVIALFCIFKDIIQLHFGLDTATFILTVTLVIPCGLRQLLYQYLRVINNSFLYTISIFLYQLFLIVLFLIFVKGVYNANAILLAMNIAIVFIDIYILKKINFTLSFKISFKKQVMIETMRYAIPLVLTNVSYWLLLHFSKMYFQNASLFLYTSIIGFTWILVQYIIQPVGSVFMFAGFPVLVSKYEHKEQVEQYWTRLVQLYVLSILPLTLFFCFYFNEVTQAIFPKEYYTGAFVLPFFAIAVFSHELLKLVNSKYHLQNKTYYEMLVAVLAVPLVILINIVLIKEYILLGAAIAICASELLLLLINGFVRFKNFAYLNYMKVFKSICLTGILGVLVYFIIAAINVGLNSIAVLAGKVINIIDMVLYFVIYYSLCILLKRTILISK